MDEEGIQKTENKKIYIGHPIEVDAAKFREELEQLRNLCNCENNEKIEKKILEIVPTFTHTMLWNQ